MAFLAQENSLPISCNNDINSAFLMSFLEESSGEDYNHEELDRLMRSLEAEINENMMEIQDSMMEVEISPRYNGEESNGLESIDLHFHWAEIEPMPSPSASDDMNWHMDFEGEALIEIGDDYSHICYDNILEGQMYATSS